MFFLRRSGGRALLKEEDLDMVEVEFLLVLGSPGELFVLLRSYVWRIFLCLSVLRLVKSHESPNMTNLFVDIGIQADFKSLRESEELFVHLLKLDVVEDLYVFVIKEHEFPSFL